MVNVVAEDAAKLAPSGQPRRLVFAHHAAQVSALLSVATGWAFER